MTIVFPESDGLLVEQKPGESPAEWRRAVEAILSAMEKPPASPPADGAALHHNGRTFRAVRCSAAAGAFIVRAAAAGLLTRSVLAAGVEHDRLSPVLCCWTDGRCRRLEGEALPTGLWPPGTPAELRRLMRRARAAAAGNSAEMAIMFALAGASLVALLAAWRGFSAHVAAAWHLPLAAALLVAWAVIVHRPVRAAVRRLLPLRGTLAMVGAAGEVELAGDVARGAGSRRT